MDHATYACQFCRAKLNLTGNFDSLLLNLRQSNVLNASVLDNSKIDESFIVLDDKRPGGVPNKGLEESFVVLGSASLLRQAPASSAQPAGQSAASEGSAAAGLDAKLQALAQLFELASSQTQVDHPLCLDCATQLKDEVEAQIQDAEREIAAYSAAAARLEAANTQPADAADFAREMQQAKDTEEQERLRAEQLEAELAEVQRELSSLQAASADIDSLEERYWHDFNDYALQLSAHVEERDALLSRIERASHRLALLKTTNVYNDAFRIWHDGPFGTISGFRLGRTAEVHVDWDEINAAWGQAVLLLHTMAQACKLTFSYRLMPLGSYPRVADKRSTYDLFGPVNKLWSSSYDRAMVCFLACLKEFGDAARSRDLATSQDKPFEFPFPIDGDKVGHLTIKLTLNKDARWTKALKFMLADLKVALQWMVKHELQEAPSPANLQPERPTVQALG